MLARAILGIAEEQARKFGTAIDSEDTRPIKGSKVFVQPNKFPDSRY